MTLEFVRSQIKYYKDNLNAFVSYSDRLTIAGLYNWWQQVERRHVDYKPSIEKQKFELFMKKFKKGDFGTQRLGQAFYGYMKLDRLSNQVQLKNLYIKDGQQAISLINEIFEMN